MVFHSTPVLQTLVNKQKCAVRLHTVHETEVLSIDDISP